MDSSKRAFPAHMQLCIPSHILEHQEFRTGAIFMKTTATLLPLAVLMIASLSLASIFYLLFFLWTTTTTSANYQEEGPPN